MIKFDDIINNKVINIFIYYINGLLLWLIAYILFSNFFVLFALINFVFFGIHAMFSFKSFKEFHILDIVLFFINCIYYNILLLIGDIIYLINFIKSRNEENQKDEYKEEDEYE